MIQWSQVTWYSKLVAVFVFLAVFGLGIMLGSTYEKLKNPNAFVDDMHDTNQAPIVHAPEQNFPLSTSTIFTSEKLGVRFSYLSYDQQFDDRFSIKEEGNKLFISFDSRPEMSPRYPFITVLDKPAGESLRQTIERIAFKNGIPKKCAIASPQFVMPRSGYQSLEIRPVPDTIEREEMLCGENEYAAEFVSAYFLYNPQVPTKVLFINNGQDPFPSVPRKPNEIPSSVLTAAETIEIFK